KDINYFMLIALIMVFIAFLSYFLTPLLVLGDGFSSYLITGTLGFLLGWFISLFMRDLDDLTHHHHSALLFVVVGGAFLNFISVFTAINYELQDVLNIATPNPALLALIFSVSFIVPYLLLLKYE